MQTRHPSTEAPFSPLSGYMMLVVTFALLAIAVFLFVVAGKEQTPGPAVLAIPVLISFALTLPGYFVVEPNMGRVLVLFGKYRGSVRDTGFWWTNPFTSKKKISLRAHNLNGQTLKVNDLLGNPIE